MKKLDRIMVCLYLAVAVIPFAAMMLKMKDRAVFGSVPPTPYPTPTLATVRSEEYQKAFTAWFESRLGLKGYAVTTDNAILYHLFGETRFGSQVMLGEDGVLFKDEDIAYYNKDGPALPSQDRVDALADQIGALQARLAADGKALVPLIIPSKTTIYRDKIPARWTRALGQPRPSDTRIYEAFRRALDARKIVYVDGREILTTSAHDREMLWGLEARHWSTLGACLAMQEVVRAYGRLTGTAIEPGRCAAKRKWHPRTHEDYDLWRLLNMWMPPRPTRNIPSVDYEWPQPASWRPSTMIVGTSFCWSLIRYANDSRLFDKIYMDYYNRTLVEWPANIHTEVHPRTKAWREVFVGKDLYVLDLFEVFLLAPDTYVDEFLQQLSEELEATAPELPTVTTGATIDRITDLGVTGGKHYFELWGRFPDPGKPYTATITCDGVRHRATVYYQNPNGQQLNLHMLDPGPGPCDRTLVPPRTLGVSCTFHVQQGTTLGSPDAGPQRVCPGPQGSSGQDADGRCLPGLGGCS